ncbi:MAG: type II toxin-antitoxin system VapC family toxin [Rhizomicrobium sp.]
MLLDTHSLLWFLAGHRRLSQSARRVAENSGNVVFASAVSGYELAYKRVRGLLDFEIVDELSKYVQKARLIELPVTMDHMIAAGQLPWAHRDPWDRILAAQARIELLTIVTTDSEYESYGVKTLW